MMPNRFNNEIFSKAFAEANDSTKELLTSEKLANCLDLILTNVSKEGRSQIMLQYGYYLLKLIALENLIEILESMGMQNALRTVADIKECLEKPEIPQSEPPELSEEIEKIEESIETLDPVHTMSKDMESLRNNNVPDYQTSQEELLNREKTIRPNNSPRWETDN